MVNEMVNHKELAISEHHPKDVLLSYRRTPFLTFIKQQLKRFFRVAAALSVIMPISANAASSAECGATQARRTIIAIVNDNKGADIRSTRVHRYLELPLNHFGYRVSYYNPDAIESGISIPEDVAGIVSWFDASDVSSSRMTRWRLNAETPCGYRPRQIVLGHPGLGFGEDEAASALFARIGLQQLGSERAIGHLSQVATADPAMVNYETDFMVGMGAYPYLKAAADAQSYLSVLPNPAADSLDLVVVGPEGGYVHGDALLADDPRLGTPLWVLNPFAFLAAALDKEPHPIPDITTRNGRRIFFSTVSPEGWLEPEPSRFFGQNVGIAGELLLGSLVAPYPDLPVTVSVVHGDFDRAVAGPMAERGRNAALAIYALPQVEAATSGHDLVYDWGLFDRTGTATAHSTAFPAPRLLSGLLARKTPALNAAAGRKYQAAAPDLTREISDALGAMPGLLPEGKPVQSFLWIRNSTPSPEALDQAASVGAVSLGGGWQPVNPAFPVLSGQAPFSARVGDQLQVYDALGDDAAYTGNWIGDLTGFHALERTLDRTETPRRLTPFQLSYSARSALHFSTRSAVQRHLNLARSGEFAPLRASDYVSIVQGFDTVRFEPRGALSWRVYDRGGLQTLRFDDAAGLSLDMAASLGVLGATRKDATLYISLDPVYLDPLVSLVEDARPSGLRPADGAPAIADSNLALSGFYRDGCATAITATGFGPGYIDAVTSPGAHVEAALPDGQQTLTVAPDGTFRLDVPAAGETAILFRTDCGES